MVVKQGRRRAGAIARKIMGALTMCAMAAACGASGDRLPDFENAARRPQGSDAGEIDGGGSPSFGSGGEGGIGDGDLAACASESRHAEPVPVDLYFMLDSSGSMAWRTEQGESKWAAVTAALGAFVADPRSQGLGAGLQYFPIAHAGVPDECKTSADCLGYGPCAVHVCSVGPVLHACDTPFDCAGHGSCVPLGSCSLDGSLCLVGVASSGCTRGECIAVEGAYCENKDSCNVADYATPAVPVAPLPGGADAITASLASRLPTGGTPTSAALEGALAQAAAIAKASPTHAPVVVLVTDGFPTQCAVQDIDGIARMAGTAAAAAPSVRTFVVGVFTPGEEGAARANLDKVAAAGETEHAFLISTAHDVANELVTALNGIRLAALPCAYPVPAPAEGIPDYAKVNVRRVTGSGEKTTLPNVAAAASCDPQLGGWYYDDPASPAKISLCPASCRAIKATPDGEVQIVLGCKTLVK